MNTKEDGMTTKERRQKAYQSAKEYYHKLFRLNQNPTMKKVAEKHGVSANYLSLMLKSHEKQIIAELDKENQE